MTQTVVDGAAAEAAKADLSLEEFLRIWCTRGSQGLDAGWLKPHQRPTPQQNGHDEEPEWRRLQRARNEAYLGPAAAKRSDAGTRMTIDMEAADAAPRQVG